VSRVVWLWSVAGLPAVVLCAALLYHMLRVWVVRGGTRIVVPWHQDDVPRFSVLAHRSRTRDGSFLSVRDPGRCSLVFWKRPPKAGIEMFIADAVQVFAGIWGCAADCALEAGGQSWLITSIELHARDWHLSGPHYAPLEAFRGAGIACVDLSSCIDVARFRADLSRSVADPEIRHKGLNGAVDFLFGRTREDRVTCSSLIAQAILRQPSSSLAQALGRALNERFSYGEITPADLARAIAILGLATPEPASRPFQLIPLWPYRGAKPFRTAASSHPEVS